MPRLALLALALAVAGCGTSAPAPDAARASADGLAAYLADRGADVTFALPGIGHDPVEGAELTVLQVGRAAGPSTSAGVPVAPRDADYRTPADVGLRAGTLPRPRARARNVGPSLVRLYRFEGAPDAGAVRDALGVQAAGLVVYADGPLVVVTRAGVLLRDLTRAFGDPRAL